MKPFEPAQRGGSAFAAEPNTATGRRPASRRGFLQRDIGAAGLSGISTAVYAAAFESERLVTTPYRLTPPGWNAGRLSVAAIADVHAGGPKMGVEHISFVGDPTKALAPGLLGLLRDYNADHRFCT